MAEEDSTSLDVVRHLLWREQHGSPISLIRMGKGVRGGQGETDVSLQESEIGIFMLQLLKDRRKLFLPKTSYMMISVFISLSLTRVPL